MPRRARVAPGGFVYHVLNRSVGKIKLFRTEKDYAAFEAVMLEAQRRHPTRILSYCIMPNHWHFVVWPRTDGELTAFFRWMSHTHAMRWRVSHQTVGWGPLYQGRFKSFLVQQDEHLLTVCRYVERNAMTAGLVRRAEQWRWTSLWLREHGPQEQRSLLSEWPVERPVDWPAHVDQALTAREVEKLEQSERRGRPFGDERWMTRTAAKLGLTHSLRPEGRPRNAESEQSW